MEKDERTGLGSGSGPGREMEPGTAGYEEGPAGGFEPEGDPAGAVEILYGVLFQPGRTMGRLVHEPPLLTAVIVFTVVQVLSGISNLALMPPFVSPQFGHLSLSPTLLIFALLVGSYFFWFLSAAVLGLTAEFLGGRGRGYTLFVLLGLAVLPRVFEGPVALLGRFVGSWVTTLLSLGLSIWGIVLVIVAIRETYQVSTARAVATFFVPGLVLFAAVALLVGLTVAFFASFLQDLPGFPGLVPGRF